MLQYAQPRNSATREHRGQIMAHLVISALGPLQVTLDGRLVIDFESNKVRALLAYLAVESDRPHSRDALMALLWPGQPDRAARNNLRHVLPNLRQVIGDATAQPPFLSITRDSVQFNPNSDYSLDIAAFNALLVACEQHAHRHAESCQSCMKRLRQAVELYRGDFMQQFFLSDSPEFEEWAVLQRERLRRQALDALYRLTSYHERRGEHRQALQYAMRQLELDPWREEAHRQAMHALASSGERSTALAQYETCRRTLARELGVEPAQETLALYEQIKSGTLERPVAGVSDLPTPTTPFIGRTQELAMLAEMLENPNCRLVTIVGPGGIGKTRLALTAAAEQIGAFQHGVYFVPLAPLNSPDLIAPAIADTLGLTFSGPQDPMAQLLKYLCGRELLLVLDNLEHLLDGAELITQMLEAPRVTLVVTSRERLTLQAECVFELEGLDYPVTDSVGNIEQYSAVQLFVERARRVQPEFQIGAEATAVARICRLVEGLPLAIELAATTLKVQSCATIANEISTGLQTLATKFSDVPERHRSVWAAFEHSWKLLDEDERRVFRRLSIFRGGFQLEAAQQVAGESSDTLLALMDKSLLRHDGVRRFDMHELLRQYASEKLIESGEADQAHGQHLAWFLRMAQEAEPHLTGKEQASRLAQLELEIDNLRAALTWTLDHEQVETALQLCAALSRFWLLHSHLKEGGQWLEQALARSSHLRSLVRAQALAGAGRLAYAQANYTSATALAQQGLELYRELGDKRGMAALLNNLGLFAIDQGELERAKGIYAESLSLYREMEDEWGIAAALNNLGIALRLQGNYQQAQACFEETLAIRQKLGDEHSIALSFLNLGNIARHQGDSTQAQTYYEKSLALFQQVGDKAGIASSVNSMGVVARLRGDLTQAITWHEESLTLRQEIGDRLGMSLSLNGMGYTRLAQHDNADARRCFAESLALLREQGGKHRIVLDLVGLATTAGIQGNLVRAAQLYGAAQTLRESIGSVIEPDVQILVEPQVAATQAQLGQAAFQEVWSTGRAMTVEQAIAYALEECNE